MITLLAILGFLTEGIVFWLIIVTSAIASWACCKGAIKKDHFSIGCAFWVIIMGALSWAKWNSTILVPYLTWKFGILVLSLYVVIGFLISLYKYWVVLREFKNLTNTKLLEQVKQGSSVRPDCYELSSELGLQHDTVKINHKTMTYSIDWTCLPINNWWVWWPFFTLSVILDPVQKIVTKLVNFCKGLYEKLSKMHSVSIK